MILYTLACDAGHRFDSWFRDSAAYDEQRARGALGCPSCDSPHVAKTMMAPAIVGAREPATHRDQDPVMPSETQGREMRAALRTLRDKVVAEAQDVGSRFPEEARRMHDGDVPARRIYGRASVAEARALLDDGIPVLPLPIVPDELN